MKKFIVQITLLSIPFIIYLVFIIIIDPYNYTSLPSLINDSIKYKISYNIEPHLYTLIEYDRFPKRNIALGDSRTKILFLSPKMKNFANLSYGGASLNEIIQTFWYADKKTKLDTVVIGISLNLYNKYNKRFWIEETVERKKNLFSYTFNNYTFKSAILIVKKLLSKEDVNLGKPPFSKEKWWQIQIGPNAKKFYSQFSIADNYYTQLKHIADHCEKNNIKLIFWIPPSHVEFQQRAKDFGLENIEKQFKKDMRSLGELYDFDFPSDLTMNKDNFTDPLHYTDSICTIICNEILHKNSVYSIHSTKTPI